MFLPNFNFLFFIQEENNNQVQSEYDPQNPDDNRDVNQYSPESSVDDYSNPDPDTSYENTPKPYNKNESEDDLISTDIRPKDYENNEDERYNNTGNNDQDIDEDNFIIPRKEDKTFAVGASDGGIIFLFFLTLIKILHHIIM